MDGLSSGSLRGNPMMSLIQGGMAIAGLAPREEQVGMPHSRPTLMQHSSLYTIAQLCRPRVVAAQ